MSQPPSAQLSQHGMWGREVSVLMLGLFVSPKRGMGREEWRVNEKIEERGMRGCKWGQAAAMKLKRQTACQHVWNASRGPHHWFLRKRRGQRSLLNDVVLLAVVQLCWKRRLSSSLLTKVDPQEQQAHLSEVYFFCWTFCGLRGFSPWLSPFFTLSHSISCWTFHASMQAFCFPVAWLSVHPVLVNVMPNERLEGISSNLTKLST